MPPVMMKKRASRKKDVVSHWRRGMRLAKKMKQMLPAMEARETVRRYCLVCSMRTSKMVLQGCVASVCQTGRPMVSHWGTVDVPPGRDEFQQLREELI